MPESGVKEVKSGRRNDNLPAFSVYASDIIYANVCTSLSLEKATMMINNVFPTKTGSRWSIAGENISGSEPNPCPCNESPGTHTHYLFKY